MTRDIETAVATKDGVLADYAPRAVLHTRGLRLTVLILAGCVLLAGSGYYAWGSWVTGADAAGNLPIAVVICGDIEDTITATGTLQPRDFVDVGAQVSGQLKKLWVDAGTLVDAGQLLAEIDSSVYQARVDADRAQLLKQRAQIADKQAQLALARLQLARQRNLARDDATTVEAQQSAEANQKSAQAQLTAFKAQQQQMESTLRGDEANLRSTRIFAPMAGTVVSQTAKQGQILNANQQAPVIMRIADLSTMTVQAQVFEADVPKLHPGMEVYFTTLGGNGRRYYGLLRRVSLAPSVVNNVVLYDALFDVPNPDRSLMTQMTAQVFFVAASARKAVLVPVPALRPTAESRMPAMAGAVGDGSNSFAGGRARVNVIGSDGKLVERDVEVGLTNRIMAQITAGLEPGERVVTGSAPVSSTRVPTGERIAPNTIADLQR